MKDLGQVASRSSIAAAIIGVILAIIGLVLAVGGIWLTILGGSIYYVLAGVALIASGVLLVRGRMLGGWLYLGTVILTVIWALWETGGNPWALVPRVIGPVLLLIAVLLVMPTLTRHSRRWRLAGGSALAVFALTIIGFWVAAATQPSPVYGTLPAPSAPGMSDPSPMAVGADWPAYGGTYSAQRYSPLTQINLSNVRKLKRAWVAHTGDLPSDPKIRSLYAAETTPLKVGNRLYLCSATNIMMALDPTTGKQLWRYDPKVSTKWIPYTAACHGVAYYQVPGLSADQACATRVIEGTLDGRLIAVDAKNGHPCQDFGTNGSVDIKVGMGKVFPGMVAITATPSIVRGVVVTGHEVLDGQDAEAPSGVIQGFDARTGKLKWAWDMTHPDWTGMPPDGQTWTRGTPNSWTGSTGDEKLGLVYIPMGNAAADYESAHRTPAENKFSSALVAIDVTTGKPRWRFQTVRKDVWDYDLGSQATLIDYPLNGSKVPAIILPSKQGDLYVLDRRTGKPLTPVGVYKAPLGGAQPGQRAAYQPVSLWNTLRKPRLKESDMWGMSPIDQMICRIQFREARYDGYATPPTTKRHWIEYPGYNGGSDWGGIAVDPVRGVIFANYNDMPNYNILVPRAEVNKKGWKSREQAGGPNGAPEGQGDPQLHTPYGVNVNAGWKMPTGLLCKQPPYGGIRAIDIATGKTIWDRPFGTARRNGPFGIPSGLPFTIGTPNNGGAVVTASGLAFIAASTDDLIRAIDLHTGKTVWQDSLAAGGQATPMIYEANGRQYLVIVAGGHHFMKTPIGDSVIAYALPN